MLYVSNELALAIGAHSAMIYDFVVRWIYSNAQNNRTAAFVDGMWWTYNTLEYYAGSFSGFMSVRTFQSSVKFLEKEDYLKVKHKGHGKTELWFALGNNIPNVTPEALPFNGKYVILLNAESAPKNSFNAESAPKNSFNAKSAPKNSFNAKSAPKNSFNAKIAPKNSFNAKSAPKNSFNAKIASFNAEFALKDADAPSNGGASEAPKHLNKHSNLKNNYNIEVSKSEKAPESEKTNQNSLTPMSGIIDTLLNQLQGSSVVVDENLSDILGIDLNDPSCHDKIVAIGVSLNVERETMSNLIQKYGLPAVAKQLVNLHYQQKVNPAGNPAGWLVSAVARNYALSQQALECIKTQRQKQKEREEFQAKVARMRAEDAERQKRETEEFRKNGPDFDTMPDILLAAWLRRDSEKFIEKKYRAYLAGKGIPEDQHDKIVEKMRNFHPDHK